MIHTSKPFDILGLSSIPYPVYVVDDSLPKEFRTGAFAELAVSKVYAREFMMYSRPFTF